MGNISIQIVLQLIAIIIFGGVGGAFVNSWFTTRRNRLQPVGKKLESFPIFEKALDDSSLHIEVTISDGKNEYKYENLHMCRIELVNQGNQDFKEFEFGVSLSDGDKAVYIEPQRQELYHKIEQRTVVSPSDPK